VRHNLNQNFSIPIQSSFQTQFDLIESLGPVPRDSLIDSFWDERLAHTLATDWTDANHKRMGLQSHTCLPRPSFVNVQTQDTSSSANIRGKPSSVLFVVVSRSTRVCSPSPGGALRLQPQLECWERKHIGGGSSPYHLGFFQEFVGEFIYHLQI